MGLHAMYDAHKYAKPTKAVPVFNVYFREPGGEREDCYEYFSETQAEHAARLLRNDGMFGIRVVKVEPK